MLWEIYFVLVMSCCLQDVFKVGVIGTIVLTQYNSQTYRIDDVDHEMTPLDKFKMKDGTQMSYVDYYKKVCFYLIFY